MANARMKENTVAAAAPTKLKHISNTVWVAKLRRARGAATHLDAADDSNGVAVEAVTEHVNVATKVRAQHGGHTSHLKSCSVALPISAHERDTAPLSPMQL